MSWNSKMITTYLPILIFLLHTIHITPASSYGHRDLEEECDPDEGKYFNYVDESKKCKSELGLHCSEYTRRCRCHPNSGAFYNWDSRRCELPVESFCAVSGVEFKNICVDNAECFCNTHLWDKRRWTICKSQNGFCKCKLGYSAYRDNSGCFYTGGARRNTLNYGSAMLLLFVTGLGLLGTFASN